MIITGISIALWFVFVPFLMGVFLLGILHREKEGFAVALIMGYVLTFALFEVMALPMILTKQPFHSLFCLAVVVYLILSLAAVIRHGRWILTEAGRRIRLAVRLPWTVYAAALAVGVQCFFYVKYMVTNADDAYYVATSATTLQYDTMYLRSPYTGLIVSEFNTRYVCSPYSILQAFWAKGTGLPAATIAHTVLPPFLVCVAYLVYFRMGLLLFENSDVSGKESQIDSPLKLTGLFIFVMSVVNITSYYCMRNQGSVLLVRVWQGKATLAAVLLPFLFYHCYRMAVTPRKYDSVILFVLLLACCHVSSMGVALPPVMAGIFACLFGLLKKNFRYFFQMVLCCSPCIIIGICYIVLKAAQE